jgi:hypothetical protein
VELLKKWGKEAIPDTCIVCGDRKSGRDVEKEWEGRGKSGRDVGAKGNNGEIKLDARQR